MTLKSRNKSFEDLQAEETPGLIRDNARSNFDVVIEYDYQFRKNNSKDLLAKGISNLVLGRSRQHLWRRYRTRLSSPGKKFKDLLAEGISYLVLGRHRQKL